MTTSMDNGPKSQRMSRSELNARLSAYQRIERPPAPESVEQRELMHELEISKIELEVQNQELIQSRRAIEHSRERYINLYDFAPVGYLTLDQMGTIRELNLTAADLLGTNRERLPGRSLAARFGQEDVRRFRTFLNSCRASAERHTFVIDLRRFDGETVTLQLLGKSARDRATGELLFITALTDLTEVMRGERERQSLLKHVEQARKELFEFFMLAPAPMAMLTGADFTFTLVNEPFRRLLGRDALGLRARDVFPAADRDAVVEALQHVFRTGKSFVRKQVPFSARSPRGGAAKCFVDVSCVAFRQEGQDVTGILLYAEDVSDRVRVRNRLAIEKAAERRSSENLRAAKLEAERASAVKSSFLANMSHEIRTPLGAILGFAELISAAPTDRARAEYAAIILRNGRALTRIIDDILDLSKVEAGKLDIERIDFDLFGLLEGVLDLFREKSRTKDITLELTMGPGTPRFVTSDPTRLRQILLNLVGNAIKFTPRGAVSIRVDPILSTSGVTCLQFMVKDSGIGMTAEQGRRLFSPFSQADNSTTRKFGGSGLGLALSRRLAQALGGDVRLLECKEREGCTFVILVEASEAQNPESIPGDPSLAVALPNSTPRLARRILLAEDSPDNQVLVCLLLKAAGMTVDVASDGDEAVRMAEAGDYDIVLMDMQMPVLDGYGATVRLRQHGYKRPIVALTAHAMVEDRHRSVEIGCDAHLTKPLNSALLLETIERFS